MSLDLAAFHAYARGELDVYPGDWFEDAALLAEELGRLRETVREALSCEQQFVAKDGAHSKTVRILERALAQDTVER